MKPLFERHPLPWRQSPTHHGFVVDAQGAVVCACVGANTGETDTAAAYIVAAVVQHTGLVNALRGLLEHKDSQRVWERTAAEALAAAALKVADDEAGFATVISAGAAS